VVKAAPTRPDLLGIFTAVNVLNGQKLADEWFRLDG
jgi:hypothetical protein